VSADRADGPVTKRAGRLDWARRVPGPRVGLEDLLPVERHPSARRTRTSRTARGRASSPRRSRRAHEVLGSKPRLPLLRHLRSTRRTHCPYSGAKSYRPESQLASRDDGSSSTVTSTPSRTAARRRSTPCPHERQPCSARSAAASTARSDARLGAPEIAELLDGLARHDPMTGVREIVEEHPNGSRA